MQGDNSATACKRRSRFAGERKRYAVSSRSETAISISLIFEHRLKRIEEILIEFVGFHMLDRVHDWLLTLFSLALAYRFSLPTIYGRGALQPLSQASINAISSSVKL